MGLAIGALAVGSQLAKSQQTSLLDETSNHTWLLTTNIAHHLIWQPFQIDTVHIPVSSQRLITAIKLDKKPYICSPIDSQQFPLPVDSQWC